MAQYISVPTQWGNLTFDLDRPRVFKDQVFRTESEARAELDTLDERCYPLLRRTDAGEWVIMVHSQERRMVHSQERRDERGFIDRNFNAAKLLLKGVWWLGQIGSAIGGWKALGDILQSFFGRQRQPRHWPSLRLHGQV